MAAETQESIPPLRSTTARLRMLFMLASKHPLLPDPTQIYEAAAPTAPAIRPPESIPPECAAAIPATSLPGRQTREKKQPPALSGLVDAPRRTRVQTRNRVAWKGQTSP